MKWTKTPYTNAIKIRCMTDEQLAEWLDGIVADCTEVAIPCGKYCRKAKNCKEAILMWLREEVE